MSTFLEIDPAQPFDPATILSNCVEGSHDAVLLEEESTPPEFFDLSSGLAGELLHKLGTYRLRVAGVVPDPTRHPQRFQEFLGESNRGTEFRFFPTRAEAVEWLESQ